MALPDMYITDEYEAPTKDTVSSRSPLCISKTIAFKVLSVYEGIVG